MDTSSHKGKLHIYVLSHTFLDGAGPPLLCLKMIKIERLTSEVQSLHLSSLIYSMKSTIQTCASMKYWYQYQGLLQLGKPKGTWAYLIDQQAHLADPTMIYGFKAHWFHVSWWQESKQCKDCSVCLFLLTLPLIWYLSLKHAFFTLVMLLIQRYNRRLSSFFIVYISIFLKYESSLTWNILPMNRLL